MARCLFAVAGAETVVHSIYSYTPIDYLQMRFNRKQIAGITAVALTVVYSLRRWRDDSATIDDSEFETEQTAPTAD